MSPATLPHPEMVQMEKNCAKSLASAFYSYCCAAYKTKQIEAQRSGRPLVSHKKVDHKMVWIELTVTPVQLSPLPPLWLTELWGLHTADAAAAAPAALPTNCTAQQNPARGFHLVSSYHPPQVGHVLTSLTLNHSLSVLRQTCSLHYYRCD